MEPLPQHIVSIDEDLSRNVVRIEDWPAMTTEERIEILKQAGAQTGVVKAAKIQKVIFLLRDHKHFIKYFEPRVASLGPIHHGKPKYQLGERYKLKLAYEFAKGFSCNKNGNNLDEDINYLYEKVKKEIKELRECFEEEVTNKYDDEAFAWMLFMDGCAILQYIFCAANPDKFNELNIKNDSVTFAGQDLFLLENQVPYRLLNLLMGLSGKEDNLRKSIQSFIQNVSYLQTGPQQKQTERQVPIEGEPTHLLDLLRTTLLGSVPLRSSKPDTSFGKATRAFGKQKGDSDPPPCFGKTCRIWPCRKKPREDPNWQSYRNVQELKASGIRLKRSKSSCLRDISFSRRFSFYPGYLSLPPITLDDSAGPKFMNLIAYEMCLDFENDFAITSYISFLDSLIDEANDVKDLRKAHILYNFLGSDKEVANLFNKIGTDLVPNTDAYKDVKCQIQEYYDNNCMMWMAQFFHDRFNAPWTMLAFLGVLLGLVLTAAQTWLTAFPNPEGKK